MPRPRGLVRIVRNKFVAGLIILVPIVLTVQSLWWLFRLVDDYARPLGVRLFDREISGIGFVTTLIIVFVTGILFSAGPLKRLLDALEQLLEVVPVVGLVYGTIKKVFEGVGSPRSADSFKRFVLARLPGRTTPGFLTGTFSLQRQEAEPEQLCTVYIPTNHLWFGDIVILPASDIIETDLSVEQGISILLSAGASIPEGVAEVATAKAEVEGSPGAPR